MLIKNGAAASPQIEKLIREILRDDVRYEMNLRSAHRERLVCPVTMSFSNGNESVAAFSRNVSTSGISLITDQPFEARFQSTLEIYRLNKPFAGIVAECRWCKPFGNKYWASGWQFVRLS